MGSQDLPLPNYTYVPHHTQIARGWQDILKKKKKKKPAVIYLEN